MLSFFAYSWSLDHTICKEEFRTVRPFNNINGFANSLVAVFILYLAKMRQAFVSINNSQGLSLEGVFDTGEIDGLEASNWRASDGDGCPYIHQLG